MTTKKIFEVALWTGIDTKLIRYLNRRTFDETGKKNQKRYLSFRFWPGFMSKGSKYVQLLIYQLDEYNYELLKFYKDEYLPKYGEEKD